MTAQLLRQPGGFEGLPVAPKAMRSENPSVLELQEGPLRLIATLLADGTEPSKLDYSVVAYVTKFHGIESEPGPDLIHLAEPITDTADTAVHGPLGSAGRKRRAPFDLRMEHLDSALEVPPATRSCLNGKEGSKPRTPAAGDRRSTPWGKN